MINKKASVDYRRFFYVFLYWLYLTLKMGTFYLNLLRMLLTLAFTIKTVGWASIFNKQQYRLI